MRAVLALSVLMTAGPTQAVTSNSTWQAFPLPPQTGVFDVTLDARPDGAGIDGVAGLSHGSASDYTDLAVIVRFNDGGTIDVRDGDAYRADTVIPYTAGVAYSFRLQVDIPASTYSVWLLGSTELPIATDFGFRPPQIGITTLDSWATVTPFGTMEVDVSVAAGFRGVIAAGCSSDEYYDLLTGSCEIPEERGCAAAGGAPLATVLLLARRRR